MEQAQGRRSPVTGLHQKWQLLSIRSSCTPRRYGSLHKQGLLVGRTIALDVRSTPLREKSACSEWRKLCPDLERVSEWGRVLCLGLFVFFWIRHFFPRFCKLLHQWTGYPEVADIWPPVSTGILPWKYCCSFRRKIRWSSFWRSPLQEKSHRQCKGRP